jgi:acetyltransferase-like isoleucine patch superfamily enzyme
MDSKIYGNVELGKDVVIEEFCVIGKPPAGKADGELRTVIGAGSVIRSHTVIYAGNVIGKHFSTGHHAVIRECNEIGDDVSVGTLSCVEHHVRIEDGVRIHSQAFVPEFTVLRKGCWIGPKVALTNAKYPRGLHVKENLRGAVVEEGAKIGANSTVLPGVVIGRHALVGSGSVVTKDVAPFAVVFGNPAKARSDIRDNPEYQSKETDK